MVKRQRKHIQYISVPTAILADRCGFNEPCRYFYRVSTEKVTVHNRRVGRVTSQELPKVVDGSKLYLRPKQYILIAWLKKHYKIRIEILWGKEKKAYSALVNDKILFFDGVSDFDTSVEVVELALKKVLAKLAIRLWKTV